MKAQNLLIVPIFVFFAFTVSATPIDLETVRVNYAKAVSDKSVCRNMIDELTKNTKIPVYQAYLGAFQAIWAKHTLNPITKLSTFSKGKKAIENAVKRAPEDVEIRFVRLSIQKNCPHFLNYHHHIETDKRFILDHRQSINSALLRKMVANSLLDI